MLPLKWGELSIIVNEIKISTTFSLLENSSELSDPLPIAFFLEGLTVSSADDAIPFLHTPFAYLNHVSHMPLLLHISSSWWKHS